MKQKKEYSVIAFFPDSTPKKWKYVPNLSSMKAHLDKNHSSWNYMNVYNRETREFLKRILKGDNVPKHL